MEDQKYILLSIIKNFLGEPKSSTNPDTKKQWEFNCPSYICKNDHNKFNLAYNSEHKIYKCWKCEDSGIIHKLVKKYGTAQDYNRLKLILPFYNSNYINVFRRETANTDLITCPLPLGFTFLNTTIKSKAHQLAYDYITKTRKISITFIEKFKLGYTEIGPYRNRVIIPSFNRKGNINYFEARAFLKKMKPTYYKPDQKVFSDKNIPEKYDIIFNECNINWNLPVYLVEGVFDMFRIPNSIPMLGKTPSWLLISKILEYQPTIILCLDEDAILKGVEIYEKLTSLGIDVFIIDMMGKDDISKIYETKGQEEINKILMSNKKIGYLFKLNKILRK